MQIPTLVCFLVIIFVSAAENDNSEFDVSINKILSPDLICLKEREGTKCAPGSACTAGKEVQCNSSTTQCCISTSNSLTRFYLFTPKNKDNPEFLHLCGGRLPANTFFNESLPTVVLIHGLFDGVCRTAVWREIIRELFIRGDFNVMMVDWSRENAPDIAYALKANKPVAERTCCVIRNIMKQTGVTGKTFHFVGHSMGAHISGFVGQCINKCNDKLGRITGLDASNFGYCGYPPDERLSSDDAQCVDNMHVNSGDCFPIFIGCKDVLGHADFFPNGGSIQISCYPFMLESFLKLDILSAGISFIPSFCYHLQSLQFFKVSINPHDCEFVGLKCNSYEEFKSGECRSHGNNNSRAIMGMDFKGPCTGNNKYFLDTTLKCPYCTKHH